MGIAMTRLTLIPVAILALVLSIGGTATAAPSDADTNQRLVAEFLAAHPGGQQLRDNEIAYGAVIVEVAAPVGAYAAPDCPTGWFCFYDGLNYNYPRGRLSSCGWQDLGWWSWRDRTESVHYNMSTGSVVFIAETGATDTSLFTLSTTKRTVPDVAPNRNRADYVYRYC
jgi:hypothetical protein